MLFINEPEDVISLIEIINKDGLYNPSQGLKQICCSMEKAYRRYMYFTFNSHFLLNFIDNITYRSALIYYNLICIKVSTLKIHSVSAFENNE